MCAHTGTRSTASSEVAFGAGRRASFAVIRIAPLIACLALPVFIAPPASAAPTAEDIKAAGDEFDRARRAFKAREWIAAAEAAEAADRLAPASAALELAIRARERAEQTARAATLAALALERHGNDAKLASLARPIVERAGSSLHRVTVMCAPACDLVTGTTLAHGAPSEKRTIFLAPGEHDLRASWSGGRSASERVVAERGGQSELSFTAPPETKPEVGPRPTPRSTAPPPPKPTPAQPEPAGSGLPPAVFFIGAGLTLVAGGVTVWSGIDTQNNPGPDRVRAQCAGQGTDCPEYQDGLSRQKRTNILLGVTGGLGVVTAVVGGLLTDWSSPAQRGKRQVEPFVALGEGATLGAQGRF